MDFGEKQIWLIKGSDIWDREILRSLIEFMSTCREESFILVNKMLVWILSSLVAKDSIHIFLIYRDRI